MYCLIFGEGIITSQHFKKVLLQIFLKECLTFSSSKKKNLFQAGREKATIPRRTVHSTGDCVDSSSSALQDKKQLLHNCGNETREREKMKIIENTPSNFVAD